MGEKTSRVIAEIQAERDRQIFKERWTEEHDDDHTEGELADAAAAYASTDYIDYWPWDSEYDNRNKHPRRRRLIIAAALLVAEIERLDRASDDKQPNPKGTTPQ